MVDATTTANITHKYQYDEFGSVTQLQETDINPFRYVGKYGVMYENDHMVFMRARFYDPTIGRFMSEDPVWSTNLYQYADNNPIVGIDPLGLKANLLYNNLLSNTISRVTSKSIEGDDWSIEDVKDVFVSTFGSTVAESLNIKGNLSEYVSLLSSLALENSVKIAVKKKLNNNDIASIVLSATQTNTKVLLNLLTGSKVFTSNPLISGFVDSTISTSVKGWGLIFDLAINGYFKTVEQINNYINRKR